MWQRILQKMSAIDRLVGVSFWYNEDGYEISAVILKQEKSAVKIERLISNARWEELAQELVRLKLPIALHVDGRGLLHKIVEKKEEQTTQDHLNQVIPNAKTQDFVVQVADDVDTRYLSIIRKESLQNIRDLFNQKGLDVVNIFLGPFIASRLNYVAEQQIDMLHLKGWRLEFKDMSITVLTPNRDAVTTPMTLKGGENLPAEFFASYAAAISTLIFNRNDEQFTLLSDELAGLRENWEQQRFFQRSVRLVLGVLLGLLLINTLLFVSASKDNEALTDQLQRHQKTLQRLEQLTNEVTYKKAFIAQTAWDNVPKAAFYADRLAATLPDQILLTEVTIHPLDEKVLKDQRKHVYKNDLVRVRGKCAKPQIVNEWIKTLGKADWADRITDQEYEFSSQEKTGIFFFTIQLKAE